MDALIQAAPAKAGPSAFDSLREENFMLFDPDQPHKTANELAEELGGVTDPNEIEWNCPGCDKNFEWQIFRAHALPCYRKWWRVAPGWRRHRSFKGATLVTPPELKLITPQDLKGKP